MDGERHSVVARLGTVWRSLVAHLDTVWRSLTGRVRELRRSHRTFRVDAATVLLVAIALVGGSLVFLVATDLFRYHSMNHDEGVYLQQAAMLLDGVLWVEPPVPDAVRPWFFVDDGGRLYPKYSPVAAAVFAPGLALGVPRLTLAVVAAANAALVGLLARELFDARTGVIAAALLVTAPLYLLNSALFLSYAPTTAFNLLFALGYVRAHRRRSLRYALLAGAAVGLSSFSRPYTALLFALPFVGHAVATLGHAWWTGYRDDGERPAEVARGLTLRNGVVAALGTCFVGLTLGYNWLLTGDPLVFPYEAFAPADGIGFGHRQILGHEREYTPSLALEANRRVLRQFFVRWGPLGALGTALTAVGLVTEVGRPLWRRRNYVVSKLSNAAERYDISPLTGRALLAALLVTVPAGNVLFWGNLNILGALADPTDGLVVSVGPFYHFDLLVPTAAFGAAGVVALGERTVEIVGRIERPEPRRALLAVLVLGSLAVAGGVESAALSDPIERNAEHRDDVAAVTEPFEERDLSNALVFVPDPYGPWLNHPFQHLRNDPSFDGDVVYVRDRGPDGDAESLDAFPDRQPYRFTYRGSWPPAEDGVTPVLEELTVREDDQVHVDTTVGVVAGAEGASVRLEADGETVHYGVEELQGDAETIRWTVGPDGASVVEQGLRRYSDDAVVALDGPTTVRLSVTFTQPGGSTVTYRQSLTVLRSTDGVRTVWPPEERVCALTTDCGREGTYVEGEEYPAGVSLSTNVTGEQRDATGAGGE